jgi:hypothetical protein
MVNEEESLEVKYFPLDRLPGDIRPDAAQRIAHAAEANRGHHAVRFRYQGQWVG